MGSATSQSVLTDLLPSWKQLLRTWCLDGSLSAAARQALVLPELPATLNALLEQWCEGEFSALPPLVLLPAAAMNDAAGAYAISRRTIYINADWLLLASPTQVLAVLTEELGHHLDGLLNASDTPGDEGELFAAWLLGDRGISAERHDILLAEDDQGSVVVNGEAVAVERASVVSTPIPHRFPERGRGEFSNKYAFAALKGNGSVVSWGAPSYGGDSRALAYQHSAGVSQIFCTSYAFAALKRDGSVVSWGEDWAGGNSGAVAGKLSADVRQIFSTAYAFAALKADGSVVTWGGVTIAGNYGGDSSAVASKLRGGVVQIISNQVAFAALKDDGSVVTWGLSNSGGDSSGVSSQLSSGVLRILSGPEGFIALKSDGSVVSWGRSFGYGFSNAWSGSSATFASELTGKLSAGVSEVFSAGTSYAVLKSDGSIVSWGGSYGDIGVDADQLSSGVTQVFVTGNAFAALKRDGSVVSWGNPASGGDRQTVASQLSSGVSQIAATDSAFAALKADGSVVTWGDANAGGNSDGVSGQLSSGISQVFSTGSAFAALKPDGSVVTWGNSAAGGDSSAVASQLLSGVSQIFASAGAFAALKTDGSVVTWGDPSLGGNSGGVAQQLNNVVGFANPLTDDRLVEFDPSPAEISIVVSPAWIPEDGDAKLIYTFTRTGAMSKPLTVNYNVAGGATLGSDYSGIHAAGAIETLTFAAGAAAASVTVAPTSDSTIEADETVVVSLLPGSDYIFDPGKLAVGTILNDDPKGYTAGPISIASVNLGSTSLGYALDSAAGDPIQVVYPYGYASTSNPGRGWQAVVAAPTASGWAVYWRTTSNGPTARWDLDERGTYTSGFLLSALQLNREEAALNLDLNGDGYTAGPHTVDGVNLGSTSLGYALRNGGGVPLQVTYSGLNASANKPGDGWLAVAATPSGSDYSLYWRNSNTGQTVRWQLDSLGTYGSGSLLTPSQLISAEARLNIDLNGDGTIAPSLASSPEGEILLSAGPSSLPVTDSSGHAIASQRGDGWRVLAVAGSGAGFALYWGHRASQQVERWNLNAAGVYESAVTLSPSELLSAEALSNRDLNGDGFLSGVTTIDGVNVGSTSEGYALRHGEAAPLPVSWPEGRASASSPGRGWTAMAAKPQDDGYRLYWANTISGQVARWQLDRSGSYQSGTFLSSSQLISEEVGLNADLNGDRIIGRAARVIENNGRVSLSANRDGLAIVADPNGSFVVGSPFDLGVGDSSTEWQMLAAEADQQFVHRFALVTTNRQILWRNNLSNDLHVWSLDSSWNWLSSSGRISPLSAAALGLEARFQLDLNGNGVIG